MTSTQKIEQLRRRIFLLQIEILQERLNQHLKDMQSFLSKIESILGENV